MKPGEIILKDEPIKINEGKKIVKLKVKNTGDRPIQVGSHFHFFEVNKFLKFDRIQAYGKRLNIPAGGAIRFEPGEEKEVELIEFGGRRFVKGFNNLVDNFLDDAQVKKISIEKAKKLNFIK